MLAVLLVAPAVAAADPDPLEDYGGAELYARFCASCHGPQGYGDGPVAPSLRVMLPDLTELAKRSGGRFPEERVREIVDGRAVLAAHGTRPMPVWGYELEARAGETEEDAVQARDTAQTLIDRLVNHLRDIQR
jgi:mono/diheme cytochrome c family protein